jgi:hypothetical protein
MWICIRLCLSLDIPARYSFQNEIFFPHKFPVNFWNVLHILCCPRVCCSTPYTFCNSQREGNCFARYYILKQTRNNMEALWMFKIMNGDKIVRLYINIMTWIMEITGLRRKTYTRLRNNYANDNIQRWKEATSYQYKIYICQDTDWDFHLAK